MLVVSQILFQSAKADVIADWTFQTSAPSGLRLPGVWFTNIVPEIGSGTASAFHAGTSLYSGSLPTGNGSSRSFNSTNWLVGDFYQFSVSTIGFQGITVAYDQTGSATAPRDYALQYSIDGSAFSTFGSTYIVLTNGTSLNNEGTGQSTAPWTSGSVQSAFNNSFDLSSITSLNNDPTIYFRIVVADAISEAGGSIGAFGDDRLDNFIVNGTVALAPEPSAFALAILGGVAWFLRLKRQEQL